jgi:hypothetical protein
VRLSSSLFTFREQVCERHAFSTQLVPSTGVVWSKLRNVRQHLRGRRLSASSILELMPLIQQAVHDGSLFNARTGKKRASAKPPEKQIEPDGHRSSGTPGARRKQIGIDRAPDSQSRLSIACTHLTNQARGI